ncbi:MAG: DUF445 domain-containing protein [Herminiimonas sp.]|nr:DUF445 domain-containing protein [Herminiimonas sp.]
MINTSKQQSLASMRRIATALLVAVTALFMIARSQRGIGGWEWVAAFAEAAMIGALADWFAVVALFKHPLGIPIPHTAIIPQNKGRIADNLAEFVREKFLGVDTLVDKMRAFDPAEKIAGWLGQADNADRIAAKMMTVFVTALDFVDDVRVVSLLRKTVHQRLQQVDLGKLAGNLLDMLTEDNRHQALLDAGLRKIATILDDADTRKTVASMIVEIAGREYPTLYRIIDTVASTEEFSLKIATSIVEGVNRWMHDIGDDPSHPRRQQFDETVDEFIERLKNDPAYHEKIEQWKNELLASPALVSYLDGLWDQLKEWLRDDLGSTDSMMQRKVADGMRKMGQWLVDHPDLRDSINDHMADATRALAGDLRATISLHIAATVRKWDDAELVRELELSIGKDLQFIRVNGTLVGGLIGLILHAIEVVIPAR